MNYRMTAWDKLLKTLKDKKILTADEVLDIVGFGGDVQ